GADTAKIRQWGHQELSTYGIGREHSRQEWAAIGRELIRLGFARQNESQFNIVELTDDGLRVLRERKPVQLIRPMKAPEPAAGARAGEIRCDEKLFGQLREVRKRLADER